jgi:uncharacterized RDD family membrane protein YckC
MASLSHAKFQRLMSRSVLSCNHLLIKQNEVETANMSDKKAEGKIVVRPAASSAASKSAQFCAGCGAKISGDSSSCWRCGRFFQSRESGTWSVQNSYYRLPALRAYRSAPPAKRILAALVDSMFLLGFIFAAEIVANVLLQTHQASGAQVLSTIAVSAVLIPVFYFLFFDASKLQGTPGKVFYDLKLTDLSDRTVAASGVLRRFAAKSIFVVPTFIVIAVAMQMGVALSAFALCLTVFAVPLSLYALDVALAFTNEENRSLVDRLSGTMVLRR